MRTIGVVTTARADYGIYLPLLNKLKADPETQLYLIVSGMHLSHEFGHTVDQIEADGFDIDESIEMLLASDTPEAIAKSMGLGMVGLSQSFARTRPDILVVLGDRFEMYCAALAALPFKIPVAHIHGGEVTVGAIDDALRHSMTKLSHIHFVSTEAYHNRVVQLGEAPWRITVSGSLSLDNLLEFELMSLQELETEFDLNLSQPPILVTLHPATLTYEQTEWHADELLTALTDLPHPIVFTMPNADTRGKLIRKKMKAFINEHANAQMVENFSPRAYFSMMQISATLVGNSSSGIIEAPSFKLPVVNIGNRQEGRLRAKNVIDVGHHHDEIRKGIETSLTPVFRDQLNGMSNPYSCGNASNIILNKLKTMVLDEKLLTKEFYDLHHETQHPNP